MGVGKKEEAIMSTEETNVLPPAVLDQQAAPAAAAPAPVTTAEPPAPKPVPATVVEAPAAKPAAVPSQAAVAAVPAPVRPGEIKMAEVDNTPTTHPDGAQVMHWNVLLMKDNHQRWTEMSGVELQNVNDVRAVSMKQFDGETFLNAENFNPAIRKRLKK